MLCTHTIGCSISLLIVLSSTDGRRLLVLLVLVSIAWVLLLVLLLLLLELLVRIFLMLFSLLERLLELREKLVDIGVLLCQIVQTLRNHS